MELQDLKKLAIEAAREAGAMLQENFGRVQQYQEKSGPADLVTEYDHRSEEIIVKKIRAHCPDHSILTEEKLSRTQTSEYRWIVDPLDGTTNYTHGFPFFGTALGLECAGVIELGVVYLPILDELFVAVRGQGATLNGRLIQVSRTAHLEKSLLIASFPHDPPKLELNLKLLARFTKITQSVLRIGSAVTALCYIACGRVDGLWGLTLQPWDLAAPSLILGEAGGRITDISGGPLDLFGRAALASNGRIHPVLIEILREEQRGIA
jgi:myo-inositol-1(or 4)-monophosphatase